MNTESEPYQLEVLIIDSDSSDRRAIVRTLAQIADEVQITEGRTSGEAYDLLTAKQFDVALICQDLPDELGTDLLTRLKNEGKLDAPVILLTATDDIGEEVIRLGAHEFISKETRGVQQFKKSIRYAIERHRLWRELVETKARAARERELRSLEASPDSAESLEEKGKEFLEQFDSLVAVYTEVFSEFTADNSFKRDAKSSPQLIKQFAIRLGELGVGPKELVQVHRKYLEGAIEGKTSERELSLVNESRFFLLQLMGELLLFYRDR